MVHTYKVHGRLVTMRFRIRDKFILWGDFYLDSGQNVFAEININQNMTDY